MRRAWLAFFAAVLTVSAMAQPQPQPQTQTQTQTQTAVIVPSLDASGGKPLPLKAFWFAASNATASAPAMVLLHGCGGLYDRQGRLATRYTDMARRLNALGVHVLATDSLTPRGERGLCTQPSNTRSVNMVQRRRDALGALQWLAAQPGVDAQRLGLLGWSNGGSTVLAALNGKHREVVAATVRPSLTVAFYPGCGAEVARGFAPVAPLLMLLAEADDWTPAAPCKALAQAVAASAAPGVPAPEWESYAGAFHGFDGTDPVRVRTDVPNGVRSGQGVHVGSDPAAREAATLRWATFLQQHWPVLR